MLQLLRRLRPAAVTAPLKRAVAELLHARGDLDATAGAVNTLYYSETTQRFYAANTDLAGAHALLSPLANAAQVAVWGGGGTLDVLREVLPQARYFSSRTGQDRAERTDIAWQPEAVVWASGSAREGSSPPADWTPREIYDLSYGEDSAGREYALCCGARYVSGLAMFFAQAEAQREFFAKTAALFDAGKNQR